MHFYIDLYQGNLNNNVCVNTPVGQSDRVPIKSIVTQGGPLGVSLCSVTVDSIGKEALADDEDESEKAKQNKKDVINDDVEDKL